MTLHYILYCTILYFPLGFPGVTSDEEPSCQCRRHKRRIFDPWCWEDTLEESMATHSSIFACRIPGSEEPDGLQFTGSQRVRHNWSDLACTHVPYHITSYSKCDLKTSRISIMWELVTNAELHPNLLNQKLHFNKLSRLFKCTLKFERFCCTLLYCAKRQYRTVFSMQTLEPDCLKFTSHLCYLPGLSNLILLCLGFLTCKILIISIY